MAALLFMIFWTVLIYMYNPEEIVRAVGINSGYLIIFIIAIIGAFSSFTTLTIYPAVATFALGDMHPLVLGLVAGIGLTIGDTVFYLFGSRIRAYTSMRFKVKLERFMQKIQPEPQWLVPSFIYFYVGFTPFPNNVLTGLLAVTGYPFNKVITPLFLGDLTLPLLAAYMFSRGMELGWGQFF